MAPRAAITGASRDGLRLAVDGAPRFVPWRHIESVLAGMIGAPAGVLFVLVVEYAANRTALIIETEPVWAELTEMLHIGLPDVEPFSAWGARLGVQPDVITLYKRASPAVGLA